MAKRKKEVSSLSQQEQIELIITKLKQKEYKTGKILKQDETIITIII